MTKEKMVALAQAQLEAYNQRDLEKFCKNYHPQVKVYRLEPGHELSFEGIEKFREVYKARFESCPGLHCELKSRIVLGSKILDEEWVTGDPKVPAGSHVVAIYGFQDDLISHVWFAR